MGSSALLDLRYLSHLDWTFRTFASQNTEKKTSTNYRRGCTPEKVSGIVILWYLSHFKCCITMWQRQWNCKGTNKTNSNFNSQKIQEKEWQRYWRKSQGFLKWHRPVTIYNKCGWGNIFKTVRIRTVILLDELVKCIYQILKVFMFLLLNLKEWTIIKLLLHAIM